MKINQILEQTIPGLGYELVDVEINPAKLIQVFIDKDGGITIDDCETVSNHLTKLFFVEEIDFNRLEVSSPGLERPLKKITDYIRFVGCLVKIKTYEAINQSKTFQGYIRSVTGNIITLTLDNQQEMQFDFNNINKARLVFEYKMDLRAKKKK